MKNLKLNAKKILFIILMLFSSITLAQNTYLKITNENNKSVSYPPETEFELRNEHNYIILKDNKTLRTFNIDGDYTLIVYPTYKSEVDTFKLKNGSKVEIVSKSTFFKIKHNRINSHGITGEKNIVFKLSNGITFEYTDGKYSAYLNEKENYLNIEGKYFIESELGTLKISFNPKNGETWWVFEPKK